MRPAAIASRMERSERTIVRSFHAMGVTRGVADRVEQALASAAALVHLGAFWELDGERALERARALDDATTSGQAPGPLAGTVCAWKDCFDVAGLHTSGAVPGRGSPVTASSATIVEGGSRRGRDLDRQARDDAARLGHDGPDARAADLPQPARSRARPGRIVVRVRPLPSRWHRRSRAPGTDAGGSGGTLQPPAAWSDQSRRTIGAARRLHALRAELRHGRRDRAASPRPRCSTP